MSSPRIHASLARVLICFFAFMCIKAAVAQTPQDASAQRMKPEDMIEEALRKFDDGDYQGAKLLLDRAESINPTLIKLKLVQGLLTMEVDPSASIQALGMLEVYNKSDEGKHDYRGHAAVGKLYRDSKMWRQAVNPLETAASLIPSSGDAKLQATRAEIYIDLAAVYFRLEKKDKALDAAKTAAQTAPDDPKIHLQLAQMAASTSENFDEARASAEKAIRLIESQLTEDPYDMDDYQLLRSAYNLMVQTYRVDISRDPDNALIYQQMSTTLRLAGLVEWRATLLNAREFALQAIERVPQSTDLQILAAEMEYDLGVKRDALDRVNRVLENTPDHAKALELKRKIEGQPEAPTELP